LLLIEIGTVKSFMLFCNLLVSSLLFVKNFLIFSIFFSSILLYPHALSFLLLKLLSDSLDTRLVGSGVFKLSYASNQIFTLALHVIQEAEGFFFLSLQGLNLRINWLFLSQWLNLPSERLNLSFVSFHEIRVIYKCFNHFVFTT
jgi:hypothetical protein